MTKDPFPCTNPNYGRDDLPYQETWWWTRHKDVPEHQRVCCFYPAHPDGLLCGDDEFVMPDLGKVDLNTLAPEARERLEYLIAKYGAENIISLAMGEWAEKYGYKPIAETRAELDIQFKREILLHDFTSDFNRAMEKWGHLMTEEELQKIQVLKTAV